MAILLVILKIIGIVLLIPVGLIIIFMLLLCVPIKYSAVIKYDDNLTGSAKITYFLGIISFLITYNDSGTRTVLKIFGRRLRKKRSRQSIPKGSKKEKKNSTDEVPESEHKKRKFFKAKRDGKGISKNAGKSKDAKKENSKDSFSTKINAVKKFLKNDNLKKIIAVTLKYLSKLIKAILPSDFKLVCQFGFEDPYTTGLILALAYPIIGFFGICHRVFLYGNTNEPELKIDVNLSGNLYLIKVVILICMYLLSKPIRPIVINYFFGKDDSE